MISIIIVVSWHGHHPSYCAQFIRACASFSEKVFVICPEEANPIERLGAFAPVAAKTRVVHFANRYSKSGFRKFRSLIEDFRDLRRLVGSIIRTQPESKVFIFHSDLNSLFWNVFHLPLLVFCIRGLFPWTFNGLLVTPDRKWPLETVRSRLKRFFGEADDCRNPLGLLRNTSDGILTIAGDAVRRFYLWQRNLAIRRSRCVVIAIEDERYLDCLRTGTGKRTAFLPETTSVEVSDPPPELVQMIRSKKDASMVVGLLGAISPRKGIDLLVDAIKSCDTAGLLFVIAGPCGRGDIPADQWDFLMNESHKCRNLIFDPDPITSEEEFNAIVKACDILYCAYKGQLHSSNVISKAAAFRKPVLVSGGELMAKRVEEYRMGTILTKWTPAACISALRRMSSSQYLREIQESARFNQYMKDHSFESLRKVMAALSEQAPE
jgi:glycosyltransferase involved in cell wall biosynthesis